VSASLEVPAGSSASLSRGDRRAIAGYGAAVALLHVAGWGLCLIDVPSRGTMLGLGLAAYMFGLRHAFDADHIAAIDDTVRLMLQRRRRPIGVGFFFSLGHSTVVFVLALLAAWIAGAISHDLPALRAFGAVLGTLVSGTFLWLIGMLNLLVLLDMLKIWRHRHRHRHDHQLDALLARRGLLNRVLGPRASALISRSWHMYPVGLLFGLGFDTASEVALLALTGGAAASRLPPLGVFALPLLFAAGMSLLDTADGVVMTRAYGWASTSPARRILYNITTTSLSVAVALAIGTVEIVQVLIGEFGLQGRVARSIAALSFDRLGFAIAAAFVLAWGLSYLSWRLTGDAH
jgi:high-affinity nickel-transport protein